MMTTLEISIEATPNPRAEKFVLSSNVLLEGKRTYFDRGQGQHIPLVKALYQISGVTQLHFYQNMIAVTQDGSRPWAELERDVQIVLQEQLETHDPLMKDEAAEPTVRPFVSDEVTTIENILDRTIRPGLQGDGGDIEVVDYLKESKRLLVRYQGACGTCPSSTAGTLMAIQQILRDGFNPELEVLNV